MPTEITMPQMSDTMTEGTVVKWLRKEGQKVKQSEILVEIETDKAVMESEAFDSGTLAAILVDEGQKAPVGAVIAVLAVGAENPADVKKQYVSRGSARPVTTASQAPAAAPQPPRKQVAAAAAKSVSAAPPPRQASAVATLEAAGRGDVHEPDNIGHGATRSPAVSVPSVKRGNGDGPRLFASPLARRLAADKGVDLGRLRGTGPNGRIVRSDVLAFVQSSPPQAQPGGNSAPGAPARQAEVIPLTRMRAAIAAALQRSKQQIPHFYETIDIDVEDVSTLRGRLNEQLKDQNVKLSLADFVAKAVCAALIRHPALNATFDGTNITRHADVHLGIAVAVPDGLIVPVLKHADKMGLRDLREKTAGIIERARAGRQKQDEASGGTFTISSLGTYGIREFSAIINPPQVAILAVGAAEKRATVRANQIAARTMMTVTLSADHRVVDGAIAADFLRTLKTLLEEPGMMLV